MLALIINFWHICIMKTVSARIYFGYYFWFRKRPPVG